jgi:hypothetical protein
MLSYINLGLIVVIIVVIFLCFLMYFQAKSIFDKMYIKYASSMSSDMKINDPFGEIYKAHS